MATRKQWAKLINDALQKSVEGIIEGGDLLVQAKEDLDHGDWLPMIEQDLIVGPRTVQKLMAISKNPVIKNAVYAPHLPVSWDTLYDLNRLDKKFGDGTLKKLIEKKAITTETTRREVLKYIREHTPPKPRPTLDMNNVSNQMKRWLELTFKQQKYLDLTRAIARHADDIAKDPRNLLLKELQAKIQLLQSLTSKLEETTNDKVHPVAKTRTPSSGARKVSSRALTDSRGT